MRSAKIHTSSQFGQILTDKQCSKCHQNQNIYIQLGCSHKFCIICITFAYLKYKNTLENNKKIKCLDCEKISQIDQQLQELINEIIQKQLGPIVKNQSENNQSRMSINPTNGCTNSSHQSKINHINAKSQQLQILVNGSATPEKANQYYFSKCQSPQQYSINSEGDPCLIHPSEDISYICMTCQTKPLCYKCIKLGIHCNHEVKIVKKAIQMMIQKMQFMNLQTVETIQNISLYMKRLQDRKVVFEEKIYKKNILEIKSMFANFIKRIEQKCEQTLQKQKDFYQNKLQQIHIKQRHSSQKLQKMHYLKNKIQEFIRQQSSKNNSNNNNENIKSSNNYNNKPTKENNYNINLTNNNKYKIQHKVQFVIHKYQEIQKQKFQILQLNSDIYLNFDKTDRNTNLYHNIFDHSWRNSQLKRYISSLCQSVDSIKLDDFYANKQYNVNLPIQKSNLLIDKQKFNLTTPYISIMNSDVLFNKNKTLGLRNCSSRDKLLHKNNKILHDNHKKNKPVFPKSLNTSRDKRQKKYNTKTQQDERRFKTRANYKTQTNSQMNNNINHMNIQNINQKDIPTYITKCIQKHKMISNKISPFNGSTVYLMENLNISKNTSKIISKNISKIITKTSYANNIDSSNNQDDIYSKHKKKNMTLQVNSNTNKLYKNSQVIKKKK